MRLSADLLNQAEQRPNPLGEREIILRGHSIPAIENLAVTRDAFDSIDFSDNRISALINFPHLKRLSSLSLSGNVIESIDAKNLKKNLPNLENLTLSENRIKGLSEIANLGEGCPKLKFLCLHGNPVTRKQYYRLYTIHKIPSLNVLDYSKITQSERNQAKRLAISAAGAALEMDIKIEARESSSAAKTFVPGESQSAKEGFIMNFNSEQKAKIREMIANATSPEEIEKIEKAVKRGEFPRTDAGSITNDGKRKAGQITDGENETDEKKSRVEAEEE